jgi:hypothetical protein
LGLIDLRNRNPDFDLIVPATVLSLPPDRANGAGILCQHGHGAFGRLPVIGERDTAEKEAELERHAFDGGHVYRIDPAIAWFDRWLCSSE